MGFTQRMCARRKLITFNRLREECTQEEARLIIREEKMGATEDQALTIQEDPSSDEEYEGLNS